MDVVVVVFLIIVFEYRKFFQALQGFVFSKYLPVFTWWVTIMYKLDQQN